MCIRDRTERPDVLTEADCARSLADVGRPDAQGRPVVDKIVGCCVHGGRLGRPRPFLLAESFPPPSDRGWRSVQ
eukprot:10431329-Alexandrium_andersonii.AAC.1